MQNNQVDSLPTTKSHQFQQQTTTVILDNQQYSFDGLSKYHIWAYGVGHTLNDLTATCWFNYLFYFLKKILFVDSAATAILAGQVVEGLATPFIAYFSDKVNTRIGQRKPWYIASIVFIFPTIILLFFGFKFDNQQIESLFYISMAILYCLGFAGLQISHMSLVPSLTCSRKRRDVLNNLRNSFTFISNFVVLGMGLIIFTFMEDKLLQYKLLAIFSALVGFVASIYFVIAINQRKLSQECHQKQIRLKTILKSQKNQDIQTLESNQQSKDEEFKSENQINELAVLTKKFSSVNHWLKMPKFYLYGVCYISARMYINMSGTFLPFYITDVLKMVPTHEQKMSFNLALIPMLVYTGSVLASCKISKLYILIGRKKVIFIGTFICLLCSVGMVIIDANTSHYFYLLALLIGISQSLVLSTGVNLISEVVGSKSKSAAFVFGFYGMIDKIVVGLGIYFVGSTKAYSISSQFLTQQDIQFIKWTVILVPTISCLISSLTLITTSVEEYVKDDNRKDKVSNNKLQSLQKQLVL